MSTRKFFKALPEKDQKINLINALTMALKESDENKAKWRTDLIGIALQYGGSSMRREDFETLLPKEVLVFYESLK